MCCILKRSSLGSLFEPILFTIIDFFSLYRETHFGFMGNNLILVLEYRIIYVFLSMYWMTINSYYQKQQNRFRGKNFVEYFQAKKNFQQLRAAFPSVDIFD